MARTRKTREHSDGFNDKLKKLQTYLLVLRDLFFVICHYICVCHISEHVCPDDI